MSFRTVVVKSRAKLDVSMNYLVYRGEVTKKIHLSEISTLIIESTAVALTSALLIQLLQHKVKIIFCDDIHMPSGQLVSFYDNYHSSKNISQQVNWSNEIKDIVWRDIIKQKINNQAKVADLYQKDASLLYRYIDEVEVGDNTNREGHAAKVYFNLLFDEFDRRTPCFFNSALNYGYAILLSAFAREIVSNGYLTQLGIWHHNEFNYYNLASDFMEPYRPIVDNLVLTLTRDDVYFKSKMRELINVKVNIDGKNMFLENAIEIFVKSIFGALNKENVSLIKNYKSYELQTNENNSNV